MPNGNINKKTLLFSETQASKVTYPQQVSPMELSIKNFVILWHLSQ